ncbi:unnamed protein product [Cunninghamella blakesleeana]
MALNNSILLSTPNVALEKHLSFWDRKNKGYITPVDAVLGFVNLGYNVIFSITIGTILSVLFSVISQDTLLLDPRFRTNIKGFQNNMKNAPYDENGNFDPDLFDELFSKYSKSDIGGKSITLKEILLEWNDLSYKTPITSTKIALEWLTTYFLVGHHWILKREDVQAAYDGSLFYRLREQNKQHHHIHHEKKKQPKYYSNIQISGFQLPKTYVYQLETQLNSIIHLLPKSAVTKIETQFYHLLHLMKEKNENQHLYVLNGVSSKSSIVSTSRNILSSLSNGFLSSSNNNNNYNYNDDNNNNNNNNNNNEKQEENSETYYHGGSLTGVLALNLLDHQSIHLAGVKGYQQSDEELDDQDNENRSMDQHHYLTGLKSPEEEDEEQINEATFGIQVVQEQQHNNVYLTGVPSYLNEEIELEEEEDEEVNNEADDEHEVEDQKSNDFISPISTGILLPTTTANDNKDNNNNDKENEKENDENIDNDNYLKQDDDHEKYVNNNNNENNNNDNKNNDNKNNNNSSSSSNNNDKNNKNNEKNSKIIRKQGSNKHLLSSSSISSSSSSQDDDEDFDRTPISPTLQDHQEALKKIESNNEWPSLTEVAHN